MSSIDYIFTVVREPVERIVSEYKWRIRDPSTAEGFDHWYQNSRIIYKSNPFIFDNHLRPQVDFILPRCDIYRLSSGLQNIVDDISSRLGLKFLNACIDNQKKDVHLKRAGSDPVLISRLLKASPSNHSIKRIQIDYNDDFELMSKFYLDQLWIKSYLT